MSWIDALTPIVDSGVPEAANNGLPDLSSLIDGQGIDTGGADPTGTWGNILKAFSGISPTVLSGLLGAGGPLAALLGQLSAGGKTGSTSGSNTGFSNMSNTQDTSRNITTSNNQIRTNTDTGYGNSVDQTTIDPQARAAMDRLTSMLNQNAGGAQGAYNSGLSMLEQLARGTMGSIQNGSGASEIPGQPQGPNTTPSPAGVTGFPTQLPTAYNAGLGDLIKQAFGSFVGDLGGQAITNARNRGFSGGGELLNSAAAPMMGQSLAQVPAMESKAYLDHVLQAYGLQSENAGRENAARANSLNAATNSLMPGIQKYGADVSKYGMDVSKYGIDRNADNNRLGQMTSLLQALMGPQNQLMQGNLGLLNSAPRGATRNTLTGSSGTQSLSGTSNENVNQHQTSLSQGTSGGTSNNTTSVPLGPQIGQGIANIAQGASVGVANQQARDAAVAAQERASSFQQSLLDAISRRNS